MCSRAHTPQKRGRFPYCEIYLLERLCKIKRYDLEEVGGASGEKLPLSFSEQLFQYGAAVNVTASQKEEDDRLKIPLATLHLIHNGNGVNCSEERTTQFQYNKMYETLLRFLTSQGVGVNCPKIPGDLDPLEFNQERYRQLVTQALVNSGMDTNSVLHCSAIGFCNNLQRLQRNTMGEVGNDEGETDANYRKVVSSLLQVGTEVNCLRKKERLTTPEMNEEYLIITQVLLTNGNRVNNNNCFVEY